MLDPRGEHVDGRLDRQLPRRNRGDGRTRNRADRRVARHAVGRNLVADIGVGDDSQPLALERDQQRRDAVLPEPLDRLANRHVGLAEGRRAHDRGDRRGPHLVQAVHGLAGAGQPPSHRLRDVGRAGLGAEQAASRGSVKQRARGRLSSADGERRGHPGQQRRMAEAFPRLEHLDHLAVVDQAHRAGHDHPQPHGREPVFDEHIVTRLERVLGHVR